MAKAPKSKVVAATGTAVGHRGGVEAAKRIEAAMVKAIEDAHAEGITDAKELRKRIRAARDEAVG